MGYSTSYLGRFDVEPRLNPGEVEWLRALARAGVNTEDPYTVPMNPVADRTNGTTQVRPLDWLPCLDGCCLVWESVDKSNCAAVDLQYLVDHFLRPGAHAGSDGRGDFAPFTFDHHVSGIVAAENGETRELFLIVATDNDFEESTLVPGDPYPW